MIRFHHITFLALLTGMFALTSCAGHEGLKAGLLKSVDTPASPIVEKIQVSVATGSS